MKRSVCYLALILALLLAGCGCTLRPTATAPVTVVKITVRYDGTTPHTQRQYVSSEKIRAILNYLRWIDPYGKPGKDPETIPGGLYRITLHLSDGSQSVYLQKADQYMKIDEQPWQTIDTKKALTLGKLLAEMESDI